MSAVSEVSTTAGHVPASGTGCGCGMRQRYRIARRRGRRFGFTLMEMMISLFIAALLIGWYIRATAEADELLVFIRGSDAVKLHRDVRQRRAAVLGVQWVDPRDMEYFSSSVDAESNAERTAEGEGAVAAAPAEAAGGEATGAGE